MAPAKRGHIVAASIYWVGPVDGPPVFLPGDPSEFVFLPDASGFGSPTPLFVIFPDEEVPVDAPSEPLVAPGEPSELVFLPAASGFGVLLDSEDDAPAALLSAAATGPARSAIAAAPASKACVFFMTFLHVVVREELVTKRRGSGNSSRSNHSSTAARRRETSCGFEHGLAVPSGDALQHHWIRRTAVVLSDNRSGAEVRVAS